MINLKKESKFYKNVDASYKYDNVIDKGLLPVLESFMKKIQSEISDPFYHDKIQELEFISRSGFSAHGHNRGGLDLIAFTDVGSCYGGGYDYSDATEQWQNAFDQIKAENKELSEDDVFEKTLEYCSNEYMTMAYRVRVMYEGENQVCVHFGWDHDAPYFRWRNNAEQIEITFTSKRDLAKKLNAIVKQVLDGIEA